MDDLKTLIDKAHDSDIKLMVDVVLNHAGYGMNKEEANIGANNYPTSEDRKLFGNMFRDVAGNDFETQEVSGLPDFRTEDPKVRETLINWQKSWIEKSNIRKNNSLVFSKGDRVTIGGSDEEKFSAFSRTYNGESIVTVLNIDENGVVDVAILAMSEGGTVILTTKKTPNDSDNGNVDNGVNKGESEDTVKTGDSLKMEGVIFLAILMVTSLGTITIIKNKKKIAK